MTPEEEAIYTLLYDSLLAAYPIVSENVRHALKDLLILLKRPDLAEKAITL